MPRKFAEVFALHAAGALRLRAPWWSQMARLAAAVLLALCLGARPAAAQPPAAAAGVSLVMIPVRTLRLSDEADKRANARAAAGLVPVCRQMTWTWQEA